MSRKIKKADNYSKLKETTEIGQLNIIPMPEWILDQEKKCYKRTLLGQLMKSEYGLYKVLYQC